MNSLQSHQILTRLLVVDDVNRLEYFLKFFYRSYLLLFAVALSVQCPEQYRECSQHNDVGYAKYNYLELSIHMAWKEQHLEDRSNSTTLILFQV